MKIVLDIDAIKYPLTGIGRYAYELAKGFQSIAEIEKIFFLKDSQIHADLKLSESSAHVAPNSIKHLIRSILGSFEPVVRIYHKQHDLRESIALRHYKNATYHGPNYYLPKHDGPCVSTFHDLSIFKCPEFHTQNRLKYMGKELPKALKRADVIITDSNYTRDEVIDYSGFDPSRVLAIPLAASEEFKPRTENECQETLHRFQLTYKNYVLYAGTVEPRKNLNSLLDAYESLPEKLRLHTPLVVAGYKGWLSDDVHERLKKAHAAGWARYLGFVSAKHLPILFSAAKSFVYPSIYEGFGLPVLEALASGVPVVCSNATSLPEVAGGCALMCDHADVGTLALLLTKSLEDEAWRQSSMTQGLQRASTFSWQKTVHKTLHAYRLAATLKGV